MSNYGRIGVQAGVTVPYYEYGPGNAAQDLYWNYNTEGNAMVPVWNGSGWTDTPVAPGLALNLAGLSGTFDLKYNPTQGFFVGPAWLLPNGRGETLQTVQGKLCDSNHNAVIASFGLQGTGQLYWVTRPNLVIGGSPTYVNLTNILNRMPVETQIQCANLTWDYASGTVRLVLGNENFSCFYIDPTGDVYVEAEYNSTFSGAGGAQTAATVGVAWDGLPSNFPPNFNSLTQSATTSGAVGSPVSGKCNSQINFKGANSFGEHFVQAYEMCDSAGGTFYGTQYSTFKVKLWI